MNTKTIQKVIKSTLPPTKYVVKPYTGPSYEKVMEDRKKYMPNLYFHYYKTPLLIHQGHGQYLWDHTGKRYLDMVAGIATVNVGHSHPKISKVVQEQIQKLTHVSPIYMNEYQGEYSRMLTQKLGPGFQQVFLCNSGAEANDFAILLSRVFTGATKFLSLRNGYHGLVGNTQGITNCTTWNQQVPRGYDHTTLAFPSSYRGSYKDLDSYIKQAEQVLNSTTSGRVAGFIAEPVMGVGGMTIPFPGYLNKIYEVVRRYGGLCISDQVQTGFGRIGKQFWGFKYQGVKPDIVTMAKGIGNGMPIGAVATRKQIADCIKKTYFNTFGGGPVQVRAAIEVLKILDEEKLHINCQNVGSYLLNRLKILNQSPYVGEVRGKGLMIGIEFVKDKVTKEPNVQKAMEVMEKAREAGILVGKGGFLGNIVRVQPPLVLTMQDAQYVADTLEEILI